MGKKLLDLDQLQNLMYSTSSAIPKDVFNTFTGKISIILLMGDSVKQHQNKHLPDLDHCYQFPATPVLQHHEMQEDLAFLFRLLMKLIG